MRTNELNGRRIVSQPVEPEVVVLEDDMTVSEGGTSDNDGGIPRGYICSASSEDSEAVEDDCEERWSSGGEGCWTRWCRV